MEKTVGTGVEHRHQDNAIGKSHAIQPSIDHISKELRVFKSGRFYSNEHCEKLH